MTHEEKFNSETGVGTSGSDDVAIFAAEGAKLEAAREGEIGCELDWVALLPHVHKVVLRPPIWKGAA